MHDQHFDALRAVKLLVLDFDGVFTSGHTFMDSANKRIYRFSIQDGMGLVLVLQAGIKVAVMTSSENDVIAARMEKLGISYLDMGAHDKEASLAKAVKTFGVEHSEVAYLSDDINDMPALRLVGLPCAVSNARPEVKALCTFQCRDAGGDGAIRELCDALIDANGWNHEALWAGATKKS